MLNAKSSMIDSENAGTLTYKYNVYQIAYYSLGNGGITGMSLVSQVFGGYISPDGGSRGKVWGSKAIRTHPLGTMNVEILGRKWSTSIQTELVVHDMAICKYSVQS